MGQCGNLGLGIGLLATCGILYCVASRYWQINSQVSSAQVNKGVQSYEGLWVRCLSSVPGVFQCDNFGESYLALPASLQVQRAFMVVAGICSVVGLVAGALGLECIRALEGKPKLWSIRVGGISMLVAGMLTLAAVSWYAAEVVRKYWQDELYDANFRYEFGAALYIGWVASGLAIVSGVLMACCSGGGEDEEDGYHYNYNPPKAQAAPPRNAEYV